MGYRSHRTAQARVSVKLQHRSTCEASQYAWLVTMEVSRHGLLAGGCEDSSLVVTGQLPEGNWHDKDAASVSGPGDRNRESFEVYAALILRVRRILS